MPLDEFDDVALPISDRATDFHEPTPSAFFAFALDCAIGFLTYLRVLLFRQKNIEIVHVLPVTSRRTKAPYDVE
jgi:hypothetical protein